MDVSDESLEFLAKSFHGFKVGEDEFGYMVADILKESNVNSDGMHFDPGARTITFVRVDGADNKAEAAKIARSVASSSLVKAAVYDRDPNWG
ncbi:putative fructokinase-6, chloroplastic [Capsicum chinense]|nr:putative fructokinase-6, chloroplastic [Capsicum chinense]